MDPIKRVKRMEELLNAAAEAVRRTDVALSELLLAKEGLRELETYYSDGEWMEDFRRDEAGLFPEDLRRGVLSEDALYDLLSDRDEVVHKMRLFLNEIEEESGEDGCALTE
jgi:hypothetical protein